MLLGYDCDITEQKEQLCDELLENNLHQMNYIPMTLFNE